MGSGPDLAFVFLLRSGHSADAAIAAVRAAVERYRVFHLEKSVLPSDGLVRFLRDAFDFYLQTASDFEIFSLEPEWVDRIMVLTTDSDYMDVDGEPDPEFWKAWQDAIGLIVAAVNPSCGTSSDSDTVHELIGSDLAALFPEGEYFSFDYLRSLQGGAEEYVKACATRELLHGYLVVIYLRDASENIEFRTRMRRFAGMPPPPL